MNVTVLLMKYIALLFNLSKLVIDVNTIFLDRYVWIHFMGSDPQLYLTLKDDGSVVLSPLGKFKIRDPKMPSSSIRTIGNKMEISLDDIKICSNGYYKPMSDCATSGPKESLFKFINTTYGTMIERFGLCMTRSVEVFDGADPLNEWIVVMLPCDENFNQMFDVIITPFYNSRKV